MQVRVQVVQVSGEVLHVPVMGVQGNITSPDMTSAKRMEFGHPGQREEAGSLS